MNMTLRPSNPTLFSSKYSFPSCLLALLATGLVGPAVSAKASSYYWISSSNNYNTAASWSTVPTAATPVQTVVSGSNDDIYFSINSVTTDQYVNLNVNNLHARSVTFRGNNTYATSIYGTASRNYFVGAGGFTTEAGAGTATLGVAATGTLTTLFFDADQTWTLNSANALQFYQGVNVGNSTGLASTALTITGTGSGGATFLTSLSLGQTANTSGYVRQNSGLVTSPTLFSVGSAASAYGSYTLSSGTLAATGGSARIGTGGNAAGTGVMTMTGGLFRIDSGVAAGLSIVGAVSTDAGIMGQGSLFVTGGTISSVNSINVASRPGNGQLTIDDSAFVTTGTVGIAGTSSVGVTGSGNSIGVVNLNGGILQTSQVSKGTASGSGVKIATFNFNGGTLRAASSNSTFLQGLDAAYVQTDGARIDSNGNNITVAQSLLAPSGTGISSLAISGTGYRGAPYVAITGGGGTGATAVATIDGSGNLTVRITNAGTGYTSPPTVTLTGGEGVVTSGTSIGLGANVSGGLIKTGSGTLTLTGNSTYTGATQVTVGTLVVGVSGSGSLGNTAVTVNAGATLAGSGTIGGSVSVSGTLAPGNSPGTLTVNNSLTLQDGATVVMELSGTSSTAYDHVNVSGALTLDGTIVVSLISGFNPTAGNTFSLFSGYTGSIVDNGYVFDFSQAVLGGGMTWDTTNFANSGAVTVVPEPATVGLLGLGLVALGWRVRARRAAAARG